jgi:hypothetical protein
MFLLYTELHEILVPNIFQHFPSTFINIAHCDHGSGCILIFFAGSISTEKDTAQKTTFNNKSFVFFSVAYLLDTARVNARTVSLMQEVAIYQHSFLKITGAITIPINQTWCRYQWSFSYFLPFR